jgi:uncharacterized protein (TIGR00255 family)
MIRSMTGFGRAEVAGPACVVTVEIRSVNHRHLDVALRLPASLTSLELAVRRLVQSRLERGRVDIAVQVAGAAEEPDQRVRVDARLARQYVDGARALARELGLDEAPSLAWVLERAGVVRVEDALQPDPAAVWPTLTDALSAALDALVARRAAEGAALASELRGLVGELAATTSAMAARAPAAAARREERLRERIRILARDVPVDETRIATEVAVWAQKTDVSEELTRLRVHLDEFALMLDKGGPVGRQFDFLIQELNREVNTLGAKADDLELSQAGLAAKGLLEKMREQVQNLE